MDSLHYSAVHEVYAHGYTASIDTSDVPGCRVPQYDDSPQLVAMPSYERKDVANPSSFDVLNSHVDNVHVHAYPSHIYHHPPPRSISPRSHSVAATSTPTHYLHSGYTPESLSTHYDPHGSPASSSTAYSSMDNSRRDSFSEAVDFPRRTPSLEHRPMSSPAPIPSYLGSNEYTQSIQRYVEEDIHNIESPDQAKDHHLSRRSSLTAHCSPLSLSPHSPYYIPTPPADLNCPHPYSLSTEYDPSAPQPCSHSPPIPPLHHLSISSTSPFLPYPSPAPSYHPSSPRSHLSTLHTVTVELRRASPLAVPLPPSPVVKPSRAVLRAAAKALKEANKGKLTFVNYTPTDHKALLGGVAPSGTSKRMRNDDTEGERKRSRSLSD